jgi:hypothetical protein
MEVKLIGKLGGVAAWLGHGATQCAYASDASVVITPALDIALKRFSGPLSVKHQCTLC